MKVLVVMPGLNGQGGAEQSFAATAPWLMAHGVTLDLALFTDRRLLVPAVQEMGVTVHDLSAASGARGRAAALQALVERLRPDLVHATLYEAEVPAHLVARRTGVPLLVTWASTMRTAQAEGSVAPWKLQLVTLQEKALVRWSGARFHAINPGVKDNKTAGLGVAPERVRVAERGRDPERYAPLPSADLVALRADLGLEDGDRLVLSVARHEPPKGLDRFVGMVDELVDRDPSVMVAIAGRDGVVTKQLHAQAAALRHADRLKFLGHRDDVPALLQVADVSVCTSYREGGAMAVVEAWAAGTPVAVVPLDGLKGVFVDGQNAVVRPAEELAPAIGDLLGDEDLSSRLVAQGRADFAARFTVDRSAEQLFDVYRWAAGSV